MAGGIGTCPRCRERLQIKQGSILIPPPNIGRCVMCSHKCKELFRGTKLCKDCFEGVENPYRYLCKQCHRVQRIYHPMYKYQSTPTEHGNVTWACHRGCRNYTNWRIVPEDIRLIPIVKRPESWGNEDWFNEVRRIRRGEVEASSNSWCSAIFGDKILIFLIFAAVIVHAGIHFHLVKENGV